MHHGEILSLASRLDEIVPSNAVPVLGTGAAEP